ncbi:Broad-complex core protein isoform 6, partial [Pseudolycoriella hygida]
RITNKSKMSQFSLRWNNYINHLTYAFENLRSHEDLVDVTLCCEGRKIRAHKILLSACSTYFKDVFKENPCQHPVIIFKNVKYEDLLAIIEFMYQGEVHVQQESLSSFLNTAEMLAVQGLTDTMNPDTLIVKDNMAADNVLQSFKNPKQHADIQTVSMTTQKYPVVTQTQTSEFTTANIVIKSRTFSEKADNTDFTLAKKRRLSHEAVDEDDVQNVDEDIYEECGDTDGDLQQTENVMNDEYTNNNNNVAPSDSDKKEWSSVEINYFLDIYEAHIKCLDDNDAKNNLWLNISIAMNEMGYFIAPKGGAAHFLKVELPDYIDIDHEPETNQTKQTITIAEQSSEQDKSLTKYKQIEDDNDIDIIYQDSESDQRDTSEIERLYATQESAEGGGHAIPGGAQGM